MKFCFGCTRWLLWLFFAGLSVAGSEAADQWPTETWQRADAFAAIQAVDVDHVVIDRAVARIGGISSLTDGPYTLKKLHELENRSDWPLPAREAALYRFTRSLSELPRAAVDAGVVQHLRSYQPRTLVPHEDHANTLVPLFNLGAAVAGVANAWLQNEALADATLTLQKEPSVLLDMYLQSNSNAQRSGYLEALRQADPEGLQSLQNAAVERLDAVPDLGAVLGTLVSITADTDALGHLLMEGRGTGLARALQRTATRLPVAKLMQMLQLAVQQAPTDNAALAIAYWWPRLRHDASIRQLLLDKLADPRSWFSGGAGAGTSAGWNDHQGTTGPCCRRLIGGPARPQCT